MANKRKLFTNFSIVLAEAPKEQIEYAELLRFFLKPKHHTLLPWGSSRDEERFFLIILDG